MERRSSSRSPSLDASLRVGMPLIDREHSALFRQLERFQADSSISPDSEAFSDYLTQLGRQINVHFEDEEKFIRSCGMPEQMVTEHVLAHSAILEQYAGLNLGLMAHMAVSRTEVLELVRQWLVGHVQEHDMKLADYLPDAPAPLADAA